MIVIPDNQSQEKMDLLRVLGAEVRPVPPRPYKDADNYQKIAGRLAAATPNAIWANQFDNVVNRQAHYETTGPEIWRDTAGKLGPGHTIVTLLCDRGSLYFQRLFNPAWLAEKASTRVDGRGSRHSFTPAILAPFRSRAHV